MFVTKLQNDWYALALDASRRIVRMRRSARRNTSLDELQRTFAELFADLDRLVPASERASYSLLQDMRQAPMLDNPELEAALPPLATRLSAGWRRYAILVQTPIGKLQARRTVTPRTEGSAPVVFSDEIEVLNYLSALT